MRVEWVTDRLPDKPGWYLVTIPLDGENFDGRKYTIRERFFDREGKWVTYFDTDIVAWMELPEPWVPDDV